MLYIYFFFQNKEDYWNSYGCDEIPDIPEIPEIPEIFNGIPVKEDGSFVYGGYNQPSLDKNGQIYWPKSVVKHVGLENLPNENFEVIIGPFGAKRITSQQEIEKKHKSIVKQGWLATKTISVKEENLIFTNSNDYLKVKPCANEIQDRNGKISKSMLHLLGESCQENRIYLNQKMPLVATSSTTSTNVVSSSLSGNTVKLCDRPAEKSVRPKQSEFAQFLGPTFGLDTIYGDIEKRLTGLSDTLPFVCLNKYKISPAFIENSGFQSFRHEI